jgi:23S rRNA (adenine-N6)-dimethyltransferase
VRYSESSRHELAQNFLIDRSIVDRVVELVAQRPGPIVEWGTGDGAITLGLNDLARPLHGIEIDRSRALKLGRKVGPHACISEGDILRHAPPKGAVVVSNVPFHLTTPILRHLLASRSWSAAVLITQWEVARKRAGVGGATQLTAQWWPWYSFALDRRISADAFRPRPSVDAGLLIVDRRHKPLIATAEQARYAGWVARVFASRGRGVTDILVRNRVPRPLADDLAQRRSGRRGPGAVLPRDLRAEDWAAAFDATPRA